jgi:glucokinase
MTVLLCDLGGTGCRMVLAEGESLWRDSHRALQNADFPSFEAALDSYLRDQSAGIPDTAIIALAAPITGDEVTLSNHHWRLSKASIAKRSGIRRVHFMNDLEALGYALRHADQLAAQPVQRGGGAEASATRLVIGVGTGFNSAACSPGGTVICSETGHLTFPVETALDARLQAQFTKSFGRCSLERVLSGSGLAAVYDALCAETGRAGRRLDSHGIISAAGDADPLAGQACAEFCRILGRATGDLALGFMPKGGIWLAGGISRALAPMILDPKGSFVTAFRAKGRMSPDMVSFPIQLLNDDFAALTGCLAYGKTLREAQIVRHSRTTERAI